MLPGGNVHFFFLVSWFYWDAGGGSLGGSNPPGAVHSLLPGKLLELVLFLGAAAPAASSRFRPTADQVHC